MPRDPTGVRPQGALSRHPADWFSDNLYTGCYVPLTITPAGSEDFQAVALFNQDQQGSICKVYGYSAANDGGGGTLVNFVNGPVGSLVGPALSIRPDYPSPNVFVYQELIRQPAPGAYPFAFGNQFGLVGNAGFDSLTVMSPFPMFNIPVGWSLVFSNISGSFEPGYSFWFQLAAR